MKFGKLFIVSFSFLIGLFFLLEEIEVSANANGAINLRDGNATWDNGGYRPSGNVSGANTHARDVDPAVKRAWENGNIDRGAKFPRSLYNPERGNRLGYDVYQGSTNQSWKQGWKITRSGGEDFFTFNGWAINHGYYHHDRHNQATYIVAENKNSDDFKIYKARLTNLNAGKDLEFNQSSSTGPINNKCPTVRDPAFMNYPSDCNMEYKWVGFRAYIPLEDLFQTGNEEYEFFIIKSVSGRGNHVDINKLIYDELILPFEKESVDWNNGELNLSSGTDHSELRMITSQVIRQVRANGTDSGAQRGYFTENNLYRWVNQNESSGVTAWHGVRSHHDNNNTRYASSMYWQFGGDIATLSWERTLADITIQHIDANTNTILKTETDTADIGKRYILRPKTKGTFTDSDGNEYVASPLRSEQEFSEVIRGDRTIKFYYKANLPDPSDEYEMPDATDGKTDGDAFWELRRVNEDEESSLYAEINFTPTGDHYAIRNIGHALKLGDYEEETNEAAIALLVDADYVKNDNMLYEFSYEYTNFYRDNYVCVDELEGAEDTYCFEWEYKDSTPVWDEGVVFSLADAVEDYVSHIALLMDHRQGETITKNTIDEILGEQLLVGRSDSFEDNNRETEAYYESFIKTSDNMKMMNELKTQTTLTMKPDALQYQVSLPSGEHGNPDINVLQKGLINGLYFPVDVDESLQEDLSTLSEHEDKGDYNVFLQQNKMEDHGIEDGKRVYHIDFITDFMFITERTGFMVNYPYAYELNRRLLYGGDDPGLEEIRERVENKMAQNFLETTGQELREEIIGIEMDDLLKLQRYFIPVSPKSELEPNVTYTNKILLENIGLSDVVWEYGQDFLFEHYMFGSGHDEAWFIEQPVSRIEDFDESDVHTIIIKHEDKQDIVDLIKERPKKRMHEFRVTDLDFVDKIKEIIGEFPH